jgi:flagellar basal-body rod protein FlgB
MFLEGLFERGAVPVLQKAMSFSQQRHKILVNNVSNFDTIGYKVKDLPAADFNKALRDAVVRRDKRGASEPLLVKGHRHFRWDKQGRLDVKPQEVKDNNILFHDQNNRFIEKQLVALNKNTGLHQIVSTMLRQQYDLMQTAIRERL